MTFAERRQFRLFFVHVEPGVKYEYVSDRRVAMYVEGVVSSHPGGCVMCCISQDADGDAVRIGWESTQSVR